MPFPVCNGNIPWGNVTAVACSSQGSGGVAFVRLLGDMVLVVKGTATPAQEVFAARVGRGIGAPVPDVRVVSWPSQGWNDLKSNLARVATPDAKRKLGMM